MSVTGGRRKRKRADHVDPAREQGEEEERFQDAASYSERSKTDLNGARFSVPSSAMLETKAIGRGTMPLIIILY